MTPREVEGFSPTKEDRKYGNIWKPSAIDRLLLEDALRKMKKLFPDLVEVYVERHGIFNGWHPVTIEKLTEKTLRGTKPTTHHLYHAERVLLEYLHPMVKVQMLATPNQFPEVLAYQYAVSLLRKVRRRTTALLYRHQGVRLKEQRLHEHP